MKFDDHYYGIVNMSFDGRIGVRINLVYFQIAQISVWS